MGSLSFLNRHQARDTLVCLRMYEWPDLRLIKSFEIQLMRRSWLRRETPTKSVAIAQSAAYCIGAGEGDEVDLAADPSP